MNSGSDIAFLAREVGDACRVAVERGRDFEDRHLDPGRVLGGAGASATSSRAVASSAAARHRAPRTGDPRGLHARQAVGTSGRGPHALDLGDDGVRRHRSVIDPRRCLGDLGLPQRARCALLPSSGGALPRRSHRNSGLVDAGIGHRVVERRGRLSRIGRSWASTRRGRSARIEHPLGDTIESTVPRAPHRAPSSPGLHRHDRRAELRVLVLEVARRSSLSPMRLSKIPPVIRVRREKSGIVTRTCGTHARPVRRPCPSRLGVLPGDDLSPPLRCRGRASLARRLP